MTLRHRIARMFLRASTSLVGPNAWETFQVLGAQAGASGRLSLPGADKPAENVLWAYAAIVGRAEAMMQAQIRLSNAAGDMVESGPLYDLLARPNRLQDSVQFLGAIETCLALYNRAYIAPVSETNALPDELWILPPRNVSADVGVHAATGMRLPVGWIVRDAITGLERRFALDELIVLQTWNPHNPYVAALDPTSPLKRSLQMDIGTRESNLALFANGGMPDYALSTDREWNHEAAKEFLERFMDNYAGFGNAHKPALLYNGVKIQPIGLKPEELQSLEVLKTLTPQEIVAGFRCKPVMAGLMIGETGLSQGSSTQEQKVAWWSETGFSEANRIAVALQQFLVERYPWPSARAGRRMSRLQQVTARRLAPSVRVQGASGLYVWLDVSQVPELATHRLSRISEMSKLWGMGYPPDSLNEFFDLGLPDHPRGDLGLVPFSVQPVSEIGGALPVAPVPAAQHAASAPDEPSAIFARVRARIEADTMAAQQRAKASAKAIRTAYDAFLKPRIKATARRYSRFYLEQEQRVAKRLDAALGRARAEADMPVSDLAGQNELLRALFPKSDENATLTSLITPLVQSHMSDGWNFFRAHDAPEGSALPDFQIADPRVQTALETRVIHAAQINDTTETALRKILSDAFLEGDTPAMLSDRIHEYYVANCKGVDSVRPLTAAMTQTNGIVNEGRMLAATFAGGLLKGWLHGASDEPRPAHVAAESQYASDPIPLNLPFVVNGHSCAAPGDSSLPVEETANCTCTLIFAPAKGVAP